jgi:hypothetical protein
VIRSLLHPLGTDEFRVGLMIGLAAAVIAGALAATRWPRLRQAPVGGALLVTATIAGLSWGSDGRRGGGIYDGLLLLLLAAALAQLEPMPRLVRAALPVPGALVLAMNLPRPRTIVIERAADRVTAAQLAGVPAWVPPLVVAVVLIGGWAVHDFERRWGSQLTAWMVLVTAGGIYACVPETHQALVLLGAAVALASFALPWIGGRVGFGASYAVAGLVAWVAAIGGIHRGSAAIGAIASLGLLLAEPMAARLPWRAGRLVASPYALALAQVVVVLLASRGVGLLRGTALAAVAALVLMTVVTVGATVVARTVTE